MVSVWISVAGDPSGRRLRAVINNAGVAVNAPVEALAFPAPRGFGRGESRPHPFGMSGTGTGTDAGLRQDGRRRGI